MPANNTNTRSLIYIGDDPELRKFIHKWDSVNYDFSEDDNEKILNPKCGYGYAIYRNVKDVFIKLPKHPYDGDTFAIMDVTGINNEYVEENYINNGILIKEEVIVDDLSLRTARIYVDNTYDFQCNTKVLYNDITYQAGEIFELQETCCYLYIFLYSKPINAWTVKWVERECAGCNDCGSKKAKVIIRFSVDGTGNTLLHQDEFDVKVGDLFAKEYFNYEIYNIFAKQNQESDIDCRDYPIQLYELSEYIDVAEDEEPYKENKTFEWNENDLLKIYADNWYRKLNIVCANNTVDGNLYKDFPFETGIQGSFLEFDVYAEYEWLKTHRKNGDKFRFDVYSIYSSEYVLINNHEYNNFNFDDYYYLYNLLLETFGKPHPALESTEKELRYVLDYKGIPEDLLSELKSDLNTIQNTNIDIGGTFNPASNVQIKYFDGKDFIYETKDIPYVGEKENENLTTYLQSIRQRELPYPDRYFTIYIYRYTETKMGDIPFPNEFMVSIKNPLYYGPNNEYYKTDVLACSMLQRLCIKDLEILRYDDHITFKGLTPIDYKIVKSKYYKVYSIGTKGTAYVYDLLIDQTIPDILYGTPVDVNSVYDIDLAYHNWHPRDSSAILGEFVVPEKILESNGYIYSLPEVVHPPETLWSTKVPWIYVVANYTDEYRDIVSNAGHSIQTYWYGYSKYNLSPHTYVDKRCGTPITYTKFELSKIYSKYFQMNTHVNESLKEFPDLIPTYGIYDLKALADFSTDFFNKKTKFEFIVEGTETIINIFLHKSMKEGWYYGGYSYGGGYSYE